MVHFSLSQVVDGVDEVFECPKITLNKKYGIIGREKKEELNCID